MMQNHATQHPTAEQWAAIDAAFDAFAAAFEPVLVPLSADERRRLVKMGDGSEAFARKALDVVSANVPLMPRSFDIEEMRNDLATHDALHARIVRLTRLLEQARDTDTALGSDVMVAALEGYAFLKAGGKAEGVDALRKLLGKRFDGQGRRSAPDTQDAPATA